jgi:hypothetical protein
MQNARLRVGNKRRRSPQPPLEVQIRGSERFVFDSASRASRLARDNTAIAADGQFIAERKGLLLQSHDTRLATQGIGLGGLDRRALCFSLRGLA